MCIRDRKEGWEKLKNRLTEYTDWLYESAPDIRNLTGSEMAAFMLTEHGIYTREREEEIIRAQWVPAAFKRFWVRFFYMLSAAVYDRADMITSLS